MNLAQSNEPDQAVSSTVSITVLSVTPARAKKLFAFASVEIDIDGVQIGVHGIRAMREDGGTAIELRKFRDAGGVWRTAITLPEEVRSAIARAVFDELVERGFPSRKVLYLVSVAGDVCQKPIAVGNRVTPVPRTDPDVLFCSRYPRGSGFVVREPGGGLQGVLGGIQDQVPFIIFHARVHVAKGNRYILFAHSQKSADTNDQGGDITFFVDKNVIDVADLVV
jgi:stage V sporulation protein G